MPLRLRILPGSDGGRGPAAERTVEIAGAPAEIRIGRRADLELPLPFAAVSPLHARILRDPAGGGWLVEDLGGAGGTWLGARRLTPGAPSALAPGAELAVAHVALVFEGEGAGGRAEGTATIARRLVADLLARAPEGGTPALTVVVGPGEGRRLALRESGRPYVVGRGAACDLPLDSDEISREHASFVWTAEGVVARDLGSKNGVLVGGARVDSPRRLVDRDRVAVGPIILELHDPVDRYLGELAPRSEETPPPDTVEPAPAPAPEPPPTLAPATPTGRVMIAVAVVALAVIAAAALALLS